MKAVGLNVYSDRISRDLQLADEIFSRETGSDAVGKAIESAESGKRPGIKEAATLLRASEDFQLKRIINAANAVTKRHHGDRIGLIAPLYFSNVCWNDCSCCDMSKDNRDLERKILTSEEFEREFRLLKDIGYRTIEMVGGGFSLKSAIGRRFLQFLEFGKGNVKNFAFFVDTLEPGDYEKVADPRITMIHWQESYFRDAYLKMVRSGPKRDFGRRLNAQDFYLRAGGRKVGLSVLAGVSGDFLKDVFMLLCHARYLEKKYGIPPSSFGTVRIKPIERKGIGEFSKIPDEQMHLATAVCRLVFPRSNIISTSRETQDVIAKQLEAGATFTNTTCTTVPGGYKDLMENKEASIGQFHHESPSIEVVKGTVKSVGKRIDWDKEL